jgi:heme iron utilization protein
MNAERARMLRELLERQEIGALGTLHDGDPAVSMVPYALLADGALVIHVSSLATHTEDMLQHPAVSMLVMGEREGDTMPQALPRATVKGQPRQCVPEDPDHDAARAAYLARFPETEPMFDFGDFSLFVIEPHSVRVVGGFADAWAINAGDYARLMSAAR